MVRPIVLWPDALLKQESAPIEVNTISEPELQALIQDLIDTVRGASGAGLSAIQVGVPKRIFVLDVDGIEVYINPRITFFSPERELTTEGCLSLPGIVEKVKRHTSVVVSALDEKGNPRSVAATGLKAQALQHEAEHLDGKLYIDRLKPGQRDRIRAELRKAKGGTPPP